MCSTKSGRSLRVDHRQRFAQRSRYVHVRRLMEADMRVADLHEAEAGVIHRDSAFGRQGLRAKHAAVHQPQGTGTCPRHAFEELTATVYVAIFDVVHGRFSGIGSKHLARCPYPEYPPTR